MKRASGGAARWLFGLSCAVATLAFAALTQADAVDPSLPLRLHAGPPRALAACAEIDARGSGFARVELPQRAIPSYRAKLAGPITQPPVADERGALVIAHGGGKLSQLDDRGRIEWTVRIGPDAPASAPLISSDGTRWVITVAGELVGVSADGHVLTRKVVPGLVSSDSAQAIPLSNGGLALSSGRQLVTLDRSGNVLWLANGAEPVRALLERHEDVIAVTTLGRVVRRGGEGQLATLGELSGRVDRAALLPNQNELVAVLDAQKLVLLDLVSRKKRVLFEDPALTLSPALAVGEKGEIRLLASGLLIGLAPSGQELFRPPLSGSFRDALAPAIAPLVDARGRTAISLPDAGLTLVSESGELEAVPGSACPEPLRPTPLGPGKLALSCRSGLVFAVSGRGP